MFSAVLMTSVAAISAQDIDVTTFPSSQGAVFSYTMDGYSASLSGLGDFDGTGVSDFAISSPIQPVQSNASAGLVNVVFGKFNKYTEFDFATFNTDNSSGFRVFGDAPSAEVGGNIAPAGDFNGDGFWDMIVSSKSGAAYLIFGRMSNQQNINVSDFDTDQSRGIKITGSGNVLPSNYVAGLGDVNGDFFSDILVATGPEDQSNTTFTLFVIFGHATPDNIDLSNFVGNGQDGFIIEYPSQWRPILPIPVPEQCDFNNDGYADILLGGGGNQFPGTGHIAAIVILGRQSGFSDYDMAANYLSGMIYFDTLMADTWFAAERLPVGSLGDFNGDGCADLYFSALYESMPERPGSGTAFILYGSTTAGPGPVEIDFYNPQPLGLRIIGKSMEAIGFAMSPAGDIDGDDYDDALIHVDAPFPGKPDTDKALLIYGNAAIGTLDLAEPVTPDIGFYVGGNANLYFSPTFNTAGDVDGDGYDDFLYSVPDSIYLNAWKTYLVYGDERDTAVREWSLY